MSSSDQCSCKERGGIVFRDPRCPLHGDIAIAAAPLPTPDRPRILTAADRQAIRERWLIDDYDLGDVLGLLDTCDAMANVIWRMAARVWEPDTTAMTWFSTIADEFDDEMTPAEAAVLDAIREPPNEGSTPCGADIEYVGIATVEQLQAEVDRLTADLAERTAERDAADGLVRNILEQITVALGLPLTEAGRPRANSFLFREIGKVIECHEWDWPASARAAQPQDRP